MEYARNLPLALPIPVIVPTRETTDIERTIVTFSSVTDNDTQSLRKACFEFDIHMIGQWIETDEDGTPLNIIREEHEGQDIAYSVSLDQLLCPTNCNDEIHRITERLALSNIIRPQFQENFEQKLSTLANSAALAAVEGSYNNVNIGVYMKVVTVAFLSPDTVMQLIDIDVVDDRVVPASIAAIESLETKKLDDGDSLLISTTKECCAICLNKFMRGDDVTKMPCPHLFHTDCILSWLGRQNTCPLCRFELPKEL